MPMFDSYIFIDWSAANSRSPVAETKDSLWVGELTPALRIREETYCRTREAGTQHVHDRLWQHVQANRRVLVGFDFPYGYPHGLGLALGFHANGSEWLSVWTALNAKLTDNNRNNSNRFPAASKLNNIISGGGVGPFWCCRAHNVTNHLLTTEPNFPFNAAGNTLLQRYRICERRLRDIGHNIQSTWRLFGQGSVGSQALTGIKRLHFLRFHPDLVGCSRVWPFEIGFKQNPVPLQEPFILHAEIWPGIPEVEALVQAMLQADPNMIKDKAQVRAMCEWAYQNDQVNQLGAFFGTPNNLTDQQVAHCINEEGWILGVI